MASGLAVAPMVTGLPQVFSQVFSQASTHPVETQVREVDFVKSSVASMRSAEGGTPSTGSAPGEPDPITTARAGAVTPVQAVTSAVTVVGVTWPEGAVTARDQFQIRTQTAGTWSQWQLLDADQGDGPDPKEAATAARVAAGGTSPYVVTGASRFEVRTLTADRTAPTEATVQVVDPGTSSADSNRSAGSAPGSAAAATAMPTIHSRATWGADESMRRHAPSYGQVRLAFVHHTVSSNTYTTADVPAMIRGIYAYHVQTLGWDDIGYNFLVDRFGRTWEGRFGGMDRAVIGSQTMDYNSWSTGVSAIGNFDVTEVPQSMTDALTRVLAWKLSVAGVPAIGSVPSPRPPSWSMTGDFQPISGHRDGFRTACPGRFLYARLPEIRAVAAALMSAAVPAPVATPPPVAKPAPKPVAKPAPKPAAKPAPKPVAATTRYTPYKAVVLRQGSRGAAVLVLQRALKVPSDGYFGPRTRSFLVAYQAKQRLARSGVADRTLWNRLEKLEYPLISYRGLTLKQGSAGTAVGILQRALRVSADGAFGPRTVAAVKAVQWSAKLSRTGVVSGLTWVAIENRMSR